MVAIGLRTPGGSATHGLGRELNESMVLGRRKDHRGTVGNRIEEHWTHCGGDGDDVFNVWETMEGICFWKKKKVS